ncbi:hypothetical protein ACFONG_08880 [Uliginosibacterium paludis]|uniref:Uncharacterized protein n=1 Tax=Uliginosibacterium paludis TaxID=1615952 RepID=A0ABV2CKC2_9RHOO
MNELLFARKMQSPPEAAFPCPDLVVGCHAIGHAAGSIRLTN